MAQSSVTDVRRAVFENEPAIAACVNAAYAPFVDAIGRPPAPMLDDYEQLIEEGRVWVATIDGELAGLIVMWGEADHWYVDNVAVDPGQQGSGIGASLLAEAERQARRADLAEIRLYTNEAMTANQDFYPNRGFIETHRAVDRGFHRIFYTRRLPPE